MKRKSLANLLVQMTIDKAKKEGKHPMEIVDELKELIADKRKMERQRIIQALSKIYSKN